MTDADRALSFGRVADLYERVRPTYPPQALDLTLPPGARRVADVGAGTGKLTRALTARGLEVVAVEPDPAMRAELARRVPAADVRDGRGEDLPLSDAEVDAVLFGQSWHWVDPVAGCAEAARVLTDGGRLIMLWNVRDDRYPWVRALEQALGETGGSHDDRRPRVHPSFGPSDLHEVRWAQSVTPDELLDLVASRSTVIVRPPRERETLLDAVRAVIADHPQLAGREVIEVPYVTMCYSLRLQP